MVEIELTNNIQAMAKKRRMPKVELAQRCGVHRNSLWGYETGEVYPTVLTALLMAEALDCEVTDLFGYKVTKL